MTTVHFKDNTQFWLSPHISPVGAFYSYFMIKGRKLEHLTAEAILSKISEYDIFRMYMPGTWKINEVAFSPFRKEKNPSFLIGTRKGYLTFIDFGDTSYRGDCFTFVKMLFNLSFDEALRKIDQDFGLGFTAEKRNYQAIVKAYEQPEINKRTALIQVITRKFNKAELDYWAAYHQGEEDLRANNVYAIKKAYLNKKLFFLKENELTFGYLYEGGFWKIYRPFASKKLKWMPNNVPITAMDGKEDIQHCRIAVINKSKKDYMVMKKVFPCCCAVQNEGVGCFSPENVEYLKANSDRQILSFDSDVTGVKNSQQITKLFDFGYVNVPKRYLKEGIKDWADLARVHGLKRIEDYLRFKTIL